MKSSEENGKNYTWKNGTIGVFIFGACFSFIMAIVFPYFGGEKINWKLFIAGIIGSIVASLVFGFLSKLVYERKINKK